MIGNRLSQKSRAAAAARLGFLIQLLRAVVSSPLTCRFPNVEIAKSFLVVTGTLLAAEKK